MSNKNDTVGRTILVVVALCFVCAVIVSVTATVLKSTQLANIKLDTQKYILQAAGFDTDTQDGKQNAATMSKQEVFEAYSRYIEAKVVTLASGEYNESIDPNTFDQVKAAREKDTSFVPEQPNSAKIKRAEKDALIYLVKNDEGGVESVIFPIRGNGLWSVMYAFVALDTDLNTLKSLVYYKQGETAGLGAEVANPNWQALWKGKKIYDEADNVVLQVTKSPEIAAGDYGVDALSGATLTGNGVTASFVFWFGHEGYKPYIFARRQEGL
tara:strand:- start:9169 stop:9975 length:807 start_codon:yes stop_codon:yes gene_type:complete